jgi:protoporphyrinogen oxidase
VVIGAGPAGLTAGYLATKRGWDVTVLEADPVYVGGLSRTAEYKGYRFDIGGHRFFSKSEVIEDLWTEILPDGMLRRPRSSRIYYNGRFFSYPLRAGEALRRLGVVEAVRCVASYAAARVRPVRDPRNFEDWVSNQFGRRLFGIFFKTYTEKVWGMSCREISADWAAQRIKNLSLGAAIRNAVLPPRRGAHGHAIKSLIETFRYPRLGPGMLWEECARRTEAQGGRVLRGRRVVGLSWAGENGTWRVRHEGPDGDVEESGAEHVVSSAPLREIALALAPALTDEARQAAAALRYRDFLTVVLILRDRGAVCDNWIYVHDPGVKVGRIQNYKSWSPDMVPDPAMACYGLEYFCFEGDGLWSAADDALVDLARRELAAVGLAAAEDVVDGCVVRMKKAYPVYDDAYDERCRLVRDELERRFPTLHPVGRNGMHKYNNQDHAMMTALLTVENIAAGRRVYDVWRVNEDAEYGEEGESTSSVAGLRAVPGRVRGTTQE